MSKVLLKKYSIYNEHEILPLYKSVGWSLYVNKPELLKRAYANSTFILGAYIEEKLVGIIRVVGDGVSIVFIQDLLVHEDYQRQGIGKKLLSAVLEKYQGVRQKALLTDDLPSLKAFYRSVGLFPINETNGICFVKYDS